MYRVRNLAYDVDAPLTNKCQAGAYRAVGWTSGHTARELLIDEIARELSIDPLELRLRNALPPEPYTTPFGQEYDGGSYAESLRRAAEFNRLRRVPRGAGAAAGGATVRRRRLQPLRRADGVGHRARAIPGAPGGYYDTATVTLEPDGSATVSTGLQAFGQGIETALRRSLLTRSACGLMTSGSCRATRAPPRTRWARSAAGAPWSSRHRRPCRGRRARAAAPARVDGARGRADDLEVVDGVIAPAVPRVLGHGGGRRRERVLRRWESGPMTSRRSRRRAGTPRRRRTATARSPR